MIQQIETASASVSLAHYMSYNLNSLKKGYIGILWGSSIGVMKGDTKSLDYSP